MARVINIREFPYKGKSNYFEVLVLSKEIIIFVERNKVVRYKLSKGNDMLKDLKNICSSETREKVRDFVFKTNNKVNFTEKIEDEEAQLKLF